MAGHSKWKNIKHKKAASDAAKMRSFTKLSKEITVAAKLGADINTNPTLRTLIDKAHSINMPKDNYIKAIERAKNVMQADMYESSFYEGYGPGNVAIIAEVLSDNKNRAAAEVRRVFTHNNGRIVPPGSVAWLFTKAGLIEGSKQGLSEEEIFELILDFEIYELAIDEDNFYIAVGVQNLIDASAVLKKNGYSIQESRIGFHPNERISLSDNDSSLFQDFIEKLEELEDIQNIYHNA
jgi:YebC/PmpR family DNA-binding regulatory protein